MTVTVKFHSLTVTKAKIRYNLECFKKVFAYFQNFTGTLESFRTLWEVLGNVGEKKTGNIFEDNFKTTNKCLYQTVSLVSTEVHTHIT